MKKLILGILLGMLGAFGFGMAVINHSVLGFFLMGGWFGIISMAVIGYLLERVEYEN